VVDHSHQRSDWEWLGRINGEQEPEMKSSLLTSKLAQKEWDSGMSSGRDSTPQTLKRSTGGLASTAHPAIKYCWIVSRRGNSVETKQQTWAFNLKYKKHIHDRATPQCHPSKTAAT
jgi:hypothetical protein